MKKLRFVCSSCGGLLAQTAPPLSLLSTRAISTRRAGLHGVDFRHGRLAANARERRLCGNEV
ncbi:MAG: hypothetical protein ACI4Q3_10780 [Kiritimatiellia bacterium]